MSSDDDGAEAPKDIAERAPTPRQPIGALIPLDEVVGLARERNITAAEAQVRLQWQQRAPALVDAAQASLGEAFGGVWIDPSDGDRVKIGVTALQSGNTKLSAVARGAAETVGLLEAHDVVRVQHSLHELERANAWLSDEVARVNQGASEHLSAGLRIDRNAVYLHVPVSGDLSAEQRALVALASATLDDALVIDARANKYSAYACTYPFCDPPLRGGIRIMNAAKSCTGGFVARSNVDNKLYMMTAGHCGFGAQGVWWTDFQDSSAHNIGSTWHWEWNSGGDMSIITVDNVAGWSPRGWVEVTAGPFTTANSQYPITSTNWSVTGQRVCTTGSFFGRSDCGIVQELSVTATYGGVTVNNLAQTNLCGINGDSGAPIYSSNVAYGMLVAGTPGQCDILYQGIRWAEAVLNVKLILN